MKRINWIDWAKFIAITMVVFGHVPEAPGSFCVGYVCSFHMPLFFFLSGYLYKRRKTVKENVNKLTTSIIVPYFIYNILFYPYWFIRLYVKQDGVISVNDYLIKPLLGILCLQLDTSLTASVNGVTWFLIVLFILRLINMLCALCKSEVKAMVVVGLTFILINVCNFVMQMTNQLTIIGLFDCAPFYMLGCLIRRRHMLENCKMKLDFCKSFIFISISVILFCNYDISTPTKRFAFFYLICIFGIMGIVFLCKTLNNITSKIIVNISIGTLMIMGIHWMFIGTTNTLLEKYYHMEDAIVYPWYIALLLSFAIEVALYPLIVYAKNNIPIMLGKTN